MSSSSSDYRPTPAPLVTSPLTSDYVGNSMTIAAQKEAEQSGRGQAADILTSGMGLLIPPSTAKSVLMGK